MQYNRALSALGRTATLLGVNLGQHVATRSIKPNWVRDPRNLNEIIFLLSRREI